MRDLQSRDHYHIRDIVIASPSTHQDEPIHSEPRADAQTHCPKTAMPIQSKDGKERRPVKHLHEIRKLPDKSKTGCVGKNEREEDDCTVISIITEDSPETHRKQTAATQTTNVHPKAYSNWTANRPPRSQRKWNRLPQHMKTFHAQSPAERRRTSNVSTATKSSEDQHNVDDQEDPDSSSEEKNFTLEHDENILVQEAEDKTYTQDKETARTEKDERRGEHKSVQKDEPEAEKTREKKASAEEEKDTSSIQEAGKETSTVKFIPISRVDRQKILRSLQYLPEALHKAILATPERDYYPPSLFEFSLKEDAYPLQQRTSAHYLYHKGREVINELVFYDFFPYFAEFLE